MVMPERLPMPLPAAPEGPGSTASAARVVAAAKVASAEFTDAPKRRNFSAKYKLQILAETGRAVETGGISAILRRERAIFSDDDLWTTGVAREMPMALRVEGAELPGKK
jgi:hypothetical protein